MAFLNLNDIEKIDDVKTKVIDVWDGQIKIKQMGFADQIQYEKDRNKITDDSDVILALLKYCIVNEDNTPVFNDDNIKVLKTKNASCLFKIFKECLELNSLDQDSVDKNAKN